MKQTMPPRKRSIAVARLLVSLALLALFVSCQAKERAYWPTAEWKRASPESQGMDSSALLETIKRKNFDAAGLHSLLVIRNGYIVAEAYRYPYAPATRHMMNSVTKSFTSTALGIAIDEGLIKGVHERVIPFFEKKYDLPADVRNRELTIEDLLTMRSGMNWNDNAPSGYSFNGLVASDDWTRFALTAPMLTKSGEMFDYNTGNSQILAGILDEATDGHFEDYARAKLLDPIGIRDYTWIKDPTGVPAGGHGLAMTSEDLARLGYLFINNGKWEDKRVVPEKWVKTAVVPRVVSRQDFNRGYSYAYHWWVMGKNVFSAQGYGGQMLFVFPEKDLIVVTTATLDYRMYVPVYEMILKEIPGAIKSNTAIPENQEAARALETYTASLSAEPTTKTLRIPSSFLAAKGRTVSFDNNDIGISSLTILDVRDGEILYEIKYRGNDDSGQPILAGTDGRYRKNELRLSREISFFDSKTSPVLSRVIYADENSIKLETIILGASMGATIDRIEIAGSEVYFTRTFMPFRTTQGSAGHF
jgi:CubicO group peptidase (beta-lactamase class C family)